MSQQQMGMTAASQVKVSRSAPQTRVFKKGKLIHPNNATVFDCVVREFLEDGARLSCGDSTMLPNELRLAIPSLREVRQVRVIRRLPREIWVRYLDAPKPVLNLII